MTNQQIAAQLPAGKPATQFSKDWLRDLRNALGWMGIQPVLAEGVEISPIQREGIKHSISVLTTGTRVRSSEERKAVAGEIAEMLYAFPRRREDSDIPEKVRSRQYLQAVGEAPHWAVKEARIKVIRGLVPALSKDFAPSPPRFAEVVQNLLQPLRAELHDLLAIGRAEPMRTISPEARERVGSAMRGLADSMRPAAKTEDPVDGLKRIATAHGMSIDVAAELAKLPDARARQ